MLAGSTADIKIPHFEVKNLQLPKIASLKRVPFIGTYISKFCSLEGMYGLAFSVFVSVYVCLY